MRYFSFLLSIVLGGALGGTWVYAQDAHTRFVLGSGAQAALDNGLYITATIGQSIVGRTTIGETTLYQGFWTPQAQRAATTSNTAVAGESQLQLSITQNPFVNDTKLLLQLPHSMTTSVILYDGAAKEVRRLHDGELQAGATEILISADGLASGHYIVTAVSQTEQQSINLLLVQ